jgi:hypothetical protein
MRMHLWRIKQNDTKLNENYIVNKIKKTFYERLSESQSGNEIVTTQNNANFF